jgi:hypothetical protein
MELAPDILMGDLVAPLMALSRSNGAAEAAADGNPQARATTK